MAEAPQPDAPDAPDPAAQVGNGGEEKAADERPGDEKSGDEKTADVPEDPPEKPAMKPYVGRILTSPATLVDDYGRPVLIIDKAQTQVEVRAEETIRKKVYCGTCVPAGEGWIQANLVERTP